MKEAKYRKGETVEYLDNRTERIKIGAITEVAIFNEFVFYLINELHIKEENIIFVIYRERR